jgi:hypothetical protein
MWILARGLAGSSWVIRDRGWGLVVLEEAEVEV